MGIFPNLGATRALMRSWLGQDEIWFLAYSQLRLRCPVFPRSRAATSVGGSYQVVGSVVCESAVIDTDINKQLNRVTAIFADSSLSFVLPQGATLGNIADCLDDLGVRRERAGVYCCCRQIRCHNAARSRVKIGNRFAPGCWPN
jgi:DNA-directed RNA polymerase subunit N (RpoN/RPB10)